MFNVLLRCMMVAAVVSFLTGTGVGQPGASGAGNDQFRRGGSGPRSGYGITMPQTPGPVRFSVAPQRRSHGVIPPGVRLRVPQDYATIQGAIDASSDGDTVLVSEGPYMENIRFRGKAIVVGSLFLVDGDTSHISKTIIDGSASASVDSGSVVSFIEGEDTTSVLCGFTIQGGFGTDYLFKNSFNPNGILMTCGGGIFADASGARIVSNIIRRNRVGANLATGGAAEVLGTMTSAPFVIFEGNQITDNYVLSSGSYWAYSGGVDIQGAHARVMNNQFERDTAESNVGASGGGLSFGMWDTGTTTPHVTAVISNNVFRANYVLGNTEGGVGGGLLLYNSGDVLVSGNLFEFNNTRSGGWAEGGAVCVDDQTMFHHGTRTFVGNTFHQNWVYCRNSNSGGALDLYHTTATVSENVFTDNSIVSSVVGGGGAAISCERSSFRIINNLFARNTSASEGGALEVVAWPAWGGNEQLFFNNTVVGNSASLVGGAICSRNAPLKIVNCILWKDTAIALGNEISYYGMSAVAQYSNIKGGFPGTGNINADPLFVNEDVPFDLQAASPCIGRGVDSVQISGIWYYGPALDFDGHTRHMPAGPQAPDIGAQEEQVTVGIGSRAIALPDHFALEQNYPNPFNPTTVISYQLSVVSSVKLVVYDILGQEVAVLVNERKPPGSFSVEFDGDGLSSGVYFYRLQAGSFVETKKLLLLR